MLHFVGVIFSKQLLLIVSSHTKPVCECDLIQIETYGRKLLKLNGFYLGFLPREQCLVKYATVASYL